MKNNLAIYLFLLISFAVRAQVGINTTSPSPASVLDVESSNDGINFGGFMPPRVNLAQRGSIPLKKTLTLTWKTRALLERVLLTEIIQLELQNGH